MQPGHPLGDARPRPEEVDRVQLHGRELGDVHAHKSQGVSGPVAGYEEGQELQALYRR